MSEMRRKRHVDRARQAYVEGDYAAGIQALIRLLPVDGDPTASDVIAWAARTSKRRTLLSEEFLLALFAVRKSMETSSAGPASEIEDRPPLGRN